MNLNRAIELLRIGSGNQQATFREGQLEAIIKIIEGRKALYISLQLNFSVSKGWGQLY